MGANHYLSFGVCLVLALSPGCDQGHPSGPISNSPNTEEEELAPPSDSGVPDASDEIEVVYPGVPPAISGGTLAVRSDGRHAVAADPDRDLIHVIDLASGEVRSASVVRGSEPGRVTFDGLDHAHVALRGAGKLARVSLADGTIVQETSVCSLPRGVAWNREKEAIVVACADGSLLALSATDHSTLWRRRLELDLRDVVIDPQGTLFVSRFRSAELLEVSSSGELVNRRQPPPIQRSSGGLPFFAALPTATSGETEPTTTPGALTMTPNLAWRTMIGGSGAVVMLHQRAQVDEVNIGPGGYGFGGCETIAQTGLSIFGPDTATSGLPLSGATLAVDAAFSPDGAWVAVAAPGELRLPQRALLGDPFVDSFAPSPPVEQTPTLRLFRNGGISASFRQASFGCQFPASPLPCEQTLGQVIAVAFDANGTLYAQSREPAQLGIFHYTYNEDGAEGFLQTQTIALSDESASHPGHDLFHANVGGGLACATCHGEALDDAHVWTFAGVGSRRTQTMRGGFLGTAPFHWAGDLAGFRELVDEVMTKRMSGFAASDTDVESLATWIDSQPALKTEPRASTAAGRGAALFASDEVGCVACHSGPMLTDNQNADVGTGETLQVPSLLGLSLRAPYMHDGCAPSIRDRFSPDCGGGDQHGKTSHLSESELSDLVAYLESL